MKAPCTLKDLLPIEQAQQVVDWFDTRPLTDETLKELGFEKVIDKTMDDTEWWEYHIAKDFTLGSYPDYKDGTLIENQYNVTIYKNDETIGIRYKTVGSVKMLIEALKGDDK